MNKILLPEVIKGIQTGATNSIVQARRFGTNLLVLRDSKIVEITPDEA